MKQQSPGTTAGQARRWAMLAALAIGSGLLGAGCASIPPSPLPPPVSSADGEGLLSGRLSVVVAEQPSADSPSVSTTQSLSAAFELRGSAVDGSLDLISPLGSVLARARWTTDQAWLSTPRGERRYANLPALTRDMLGESLPVEALFDWLRGRPWALAASQASTAPQPSGFTQLDWRVDLSRFARSIVTAERDHAPKVTLRARLDTP